ncbi:hypothetical protein [Aquimarina aquimarini]|uniref:hypothetical protein n=1 Tax=Aquimarina aquimarini TaxID=1191734 RepID=UPI00131F15A9|nr:hypothetical protein [Aquimarina aquimarini]
MMKNILVLCLPMLFYSMSCKEDNTIAEGDISEPNFQAEIISVTVSGDEGNYSFAVGIKSPDKGCEQYADWWEVISDEGALLYRRILAHSHVNEQPFVRSGGPIAINKEQTVYIRVHMNTSGYSDKVFTGNVNQGFKKGTLESTFAVDLQTKEPLPDGCAF